MLIKKIGSLLLALTLVVACIPGTLATAEDAAWVHVEAEEGMGTTQHSPAGYGASNNKALVGQNHSGTQENLGGSNSITVTIPAEGQYDVFAVVGRGDVNDPSNSRGSYKFSIGEEAFFESAVGSGSITPISASFMQVQLSMDTYAQELYWINAGKVTLPAGEVTLNLEITGHGVIDCLRFVPASWNWVPTGANFDAPVKPEAPEWIHIEAEDGIVDTSATDNNFSNAGASAGAIMLSGYNYQSDLKNSAEVNIPESKNYDVWAVMGVYYNDPSTNRALYTFAFGEDEPFFSKYNGQFAGASDTIFAQQCNGDTFGCNGKWVLVGNDLSLTEGTKTLNFAVTYGASGTMSQGFIDCIRIVPSEWNWVPGANFDAPTDMTPTPDENGLIFLEGEKGVLSGSMSLDTNASASNGGYAKTFSSGNVGATTLTFKTTENALYDVWAAVGVPAGTGTHLGGYSFVLNGNTIYEMNHSGTDRTTPVIYGGDGTIYLHSGDTAGSNASVRWIKVAGAQQLTARTHTIECNVIHGVPANSTGLIDCVALVPTDWEWTAGDSFTIAKQFTLKDGSFAWIEGEAMIPANTDASAMSVGSFMGVDCSGGSELYRGANGGNDANFAPEFTYTFKVDTAGEYEIWNYGMSYENSQGTHLGKMTASVGSDTTSGIASDVILNSNESGTGGYKRWTRLQGDVTLEEGLNTLNVKYTYGGMHCLVITDAIAIVPKDWHWRPEADTNAIANAPVLDEIAAWYSISNQAANLTENLVLADRGAAGSTITYVSNNPAITNAGVVTIPSTWDGDATGIIAITATKGAATSTGNVSVVVKAESVIAYDSFEIVGDVEAGGEICARAAGVAKKNDDATTAIVVLAVYKDNALLGVYPSAAVTLTADGQDITSGIATLPSDVTGVTVQAFLWDGLASAMPYVLPVSK